MSPGQARDEEVDYQSDIWSFGNVLYEMLTRELLFSGEHELVVAFSILKEAENFREDVYYRLNVIDMCLPSLQDRKS